MDNFNIVKIDKENYPNVFEEKVEKYIMIDKNKNLIGTSYIDDNLKTNKLSIKIEEKYRGNGYGKIIFNSTVGEYVKRFGYDKLVFEVDERNDRFINILLQAGSIQIDNKCGNNTYVLPLMKWRENHGRS